MPDFSSNMCQNYLHEIKTKGGNAEKLPLFIHGHKYFFRYIKEARN